MNDAPAPVPAPPGLLTAAVAGPAGVVRVTVRADFDAPALRSALADPDALIAPPSKPSQVRKARARRAVHSFVAEIEGASQRVYLKLFRVRSLKDVLEELICGRRAHRSLAAGLEAERRGIPVAPHLGAASRSGPGRLPERSVLATLGVARKRDVRTVLGEDLRRDRSARERAAFLRALGAFVALVHCRGLRHGDLKAGNVFALGLAPPRFVLIDLDRASFARSGGAGIRLGELRDLRTLLASLRRSCSGREQVLVLASWLRARALPRRSRRTLLALLRALWRPVRQPPP